MRALTLVYPSNTHLAMVYVEMRYKPVRALTPLRSHLTCGTGILVEMRYKPVRALTLIPFLTEYWISQMVEMRHKPVRALRLVISYSYQKMKYTKMKIGNNEKHRQWLTIIMAKNLLKSIFMVEKCKIR